MAGIVANTRSHIEGSLLSQHYFLHGKEYQKSDLHTGIKVPFPVWWPGKRIDPLQLMHIITGN